MTTDKEHAALAWLDLFHHEQADTIKAMLAAPRVPDINDHKAIDDLHRRMCEGNCGHVTRGALAEIIRIMNEPEKPKMREVEIEAWATFSETGELGCLYHVPVAGPRVVRLTGKAEVPDV